MNTETKIKTSEALEKINEAFYTAGDAIGSFEEIKSSVMSHAKDQKIDNGAKELIGLIEDIIKEYKGIQRLYYEIRGKYYDEETGEIKE